MVDFYMDPLTMDIDLTAGKARKATEAEEIKQRVLVYLSSQQGGYRYDEDHGLDYIGVIFSKPYDEAAVEAEVRRGCFAAHPNVIGVRDVVLTFDPIARHLTGSLTVETQVGPIALSFSSPEV